VTPKGIVTAVSDEHDWKAEAPIVVTPVEIVTAVSPEHPEKAYSDMLVNWVGIVTAPVGHENQLSYDVTDVGMIDSGNDVLPNADRPIVVTLLGIITAVSPEQP
jgi:hypothetical protein